MKSIELAERQAQLVAEARKIYDAATSESRDATPEENEEFDRLMGEAEEAKTKAETAKRHESLDYAEAELRAVSPRRTSATSYRKTMDRHGAAEIVRSWALAGSNGHRPTADQSVRAADYGIDLTSSSMEYRALSVGTNTAGGYLVPQSFSSELDKQLAYYFAVEQAVDVFNTEYGRDYKQPTVNDVSNVSGIVGESGTIGSTSDPDFNQITFKSWDYYSPIVKVSHQALRDSGQDIPSVLAELFAERMGRAYDAAVVSANAGSAAPQGILNGVSAAVNLATGNPMTIAKLLELEVSVDPAYRNLPGTGFLMHDNTWQAIRQMADTTGRLLVSGDLQNGIEKRLLGYPVYISNNMTPITTPGDDAPLILFGALKKYRFRKIAGSTLTRINELFAGTGQVGFCLHEAYDARWVNTTCAKTLNSFDA